MKAVLASMLSRCIGQLCTAPVLTGPGPDAGPRKHRAITVAMLVLVLGAPLQAGAMTVSLRPADIQNFTQISATGSPLTFKTAETATGAGYTTVWGFSANGVNIADIGLTGLGIDWSGFDTFSLNIANNNESSWLFSVSVFDGVDTATSPVQTLPNNGIASVFNVDITGLNITMIDSVFITVSGNLPINGFDRTGEYAASTVPVPAAVWLFASALGLLGWMRRHR